MPLFGPVILSYIWQNHNYRYVQPALYSMGIPSMWFPLETFQWWWWCKNNLQVSSEYLSVLYEVLNWGMGVLTYSLTDENYIDHCCRLSLQTSTCFRRMELAVASGKPVCCGTRRRGAPGSSPRRSGTKCARWTPTAGLGWRQALELIRSIKDLFVRQKLTVQSQ